MTASARPFRLPDPGPWLHVVTIGKAAAGGSTDPVTGKFTPSGAFAYVYGAADNETPNADVQDKQTVMRRAEDGTPTLTAEGVIFLADETKTADVEEGMTGTVVGEEYGDAPIDFQVVGIQRLDGSIFVRWL